MNTFHAPFQDQQLALNQADALPAVLDLPGNEELSPELAQAILREAGRFAEDVLAPINRVGDTEGAQWTPDGVTLPTGWVRAHDQFRANGWSALTSSPEWGGQGMSHVLSTAVEETWAAANPAFVLLPMCIRGAAEVLIKHGSPAMQSTYVSKMVSGEWAGTMNLTEPHAGSDLSGLRTRAQPMADGRYKLFGQKIFITYGDHDACDNIVHLVLARLPDAPPGVKGISLFVCPKYLVNADGSLGERNDVQCLSIEKKMGIHGSPTCVMAYGEQGGAIAELVGEPHQGLAYMFVMMNAARFGVGVQGLGLAERAYQQAQAYARERRQGRHPRTGEAYTPIINHPDVQRMLTQMRSCIMAMRGLVYHGATHLDVVERSRDEAQRQASHKLVDLLMPVIKAWCTEVANEIAYLGVQVHGGVGFIEETGAAQHMRDARILTIYEGTTGIQAVDLLARKVFRDRGQTLQALSRQMRQTAAALKARQQTAMLGEALLGHLQVLEDTLNWFLSRGDQPDEAALASAVPFLHLLGVLCGAWRLACLVLHELDHQADQRTDIMELARFFNAHVAVQIPMRYRQIVLGGDAPKAVNKLAA